MMFAAGWFDPEPRKPLRQDQQDQTELSCCCKHQRTRLPMMNALPTLIVIWAVLTGLFLTLLAYNGTITRYEENQLFLDDIKTSEKQAQNSIVSKINRVMPYIRATGAMAAVMTVVIVAIYTLDAWHRIQQ
jgi:predicted membrane-bound spermidine synthase